MIDYAFHLVVLPFQLTGPEQRFERQIRWHDKCVSTISNPRDLESISEILTNRSFARTADLNFPTNGYAMMLSLFYITFSTLAVPGVMLTRKIGPRWTIPGYMIGWGSMAMLNAACTNFAGVLVVRLCKSPRYSILVPKACSTV